MNDREIVAALMTAKGWERKQVTVKAHFVKSGEMIVWKWFAPENNMYTGEWEERLFYKTFTLTEDFGIFKSQVLLPLKAEGYHMEVNDTRVYWVDGDKPHFISVASLFEDEILRAGCISATEAFNKLRRKSWVKKSKIG